MLRHAGALRRSYPITQCPFLGSRCLASPLYQQQQKHRLKVNSTTAAGPISAHLHHDARLRIRSNAMRMACISGAARGTGELRWSESWRAVGGGLGARRTIWGSGGEGGGWFRWMFGGGSDANRKLKDTLDEETRQSIRRGDDKSKRSMETVKLSLGGSLLLFLCKLMAYLYSGSSAMSSETMHSLVDSANQMLLLIGLRSASMAPDRLHQYGHGKDVYFWSLLSALGTFWLGAGVTMRHSIEELWHPTVVLDKVGIEVWGVLLISLAVDGYVGWRTLKTVMLTKRKNETVLQHLLKVRDPTTAAVLLEDGGACAGVLIAMAGCGAAQLYDTPQWDGLAGVGIAGLLGCMGLLLIQMNRRYLIGQAVDREITEGIKAILLSRGAIEQLHQVQSQWIGPHTFAFKAEVDFDGTYLAAKLRTRYELEFENILSRPPTDHKRSDDLEILLSFYTEDVMRAAEREVREAETEIRRIYPEAAYVDLEPDSSTHAAYALESYRTPALKKEEKEEGKKIFLAILHNKQARRLAQEEANKIAELTNPDSDIELPSVESVSGRRSAAGGIKPGKGGDAGTDGTRKR